VNIGSFGWVWLALVAVGAVGVQFTECAVSPIEKARAAAFMMRSSSRFAIDGVEIGAPPD
jgi:hypothetical protein